MQHVKLSGNGMKATKRVGRWLTSGGVAGLMLAGCHREAAVKVGEEGKVERVGVELVGWERHVAVEEVVGTVRARTRAMLEAKVTGRVKRMETRLGQVVKAGEVVVELEVPEWVARAEQARAVLEQAERELGRFRELREQKTVSPQEFDVVESRWRVAKAALLEAETLLGQARVAAPFDAVVTRKLADVGDLATPGRPLLELEAPGDLRLEADVGEALMDGLKEGMELQARFGSGVLVVTGRVAEIAPVADEGSRTFLVKVDLPPVEGLRSGRFGRLSVPLGESQWLRVPVTAVQRRGQLEWVFVEREGRVALRLVRTGRVMGERVELLSGVEPGERVVMVGVDGLRDGGKVEVAP